MKSKYMEYAIELAEKGSGFTNPNPLVGAVIVKNDEIIGQGYHKMYGGPHAEINAFNNAKEEVSGATLYVTLEPCSHFGKTPPCVDTIIKKNIKKVVIGMEDPNPLVSGRGVKILRDNNIEVISGVLEDKCKKQNEIFIKYITEKKPFCILKTAMTLDGKIASNKGDSKWISCAKSRNKVHQLRQKVSAIMVGVGTVISDNPYLNTRLENVRTKDPIRVIVDTTARIPMDSKIVESSKNIRTIIATTKEAPKEKLELLKEKGLEIMVSPLKDLKVDLKYVIFALGKMEVDSVLIEGGGTLNYSLIREDLVDKVYFFIAPKLIGGENAKTPLEGKGISMMKKAINLKDLETEMIEKDLLITGYIDRK